MEACTRRSFEDGSQHGDDFTGIVFFSVHIPERAVHVCTLALVTFSGFYFSTTAASDLLHYA